MKKYTTERGVKIGIIPIPLLLEEVRKHHRGPERPTLKEKLAGDVIRERPISDQDALLMAEKQPEFWADYADTWAEYQRLEAESNQRLNDKILDTVALEGVKCDMPSNEAWIKRHKLIYELDVPDDPDLQRIHYVKTEVLGGPRDILHVTIVAGGAEISEEDLALAEDSFRDFLQGTLAEGLADSGGSVDDGDDSPGDEGSEGVGQDAD